MHEILLILTVWVPNKYVEGCIVLCHIVVCCLITGRAGRETLLWVLKSKLSVRLRTVSRIGADQLSQPVYHSAASSRLSVSSRGFNITVEMSIILCTALSRHLRGKGIWERKCISDFATRWWGVFNFSLRQFLTAVITVLAY